MSQSTFLAIAKDPAIIPGVHHHCDEWCDYCLVTNRCLAFKCTDEHRRRHGLADGEPTFRSLDEAVAFTRSVAEAEGSSTPELDALVAEGAERAGLHTADPLAGAALDYAQQVAIGFAPIAELVARAPVRRSGPEPEEVVLWYHVRIYLRLVRALVAREGRAPGGNRMEDANGSAKLVLVAIQKSRAAIERMQANEPGEDFTGLTSALVTLERGIEERFPDARTYVRVGLDVPVT
jgi:hypothetical protein